MKTTFEGRQTWREGNHGWWTTLEEKQLFMELQSAFNAKTDYGAYTYCIIILGGDSWAHLMIIAL